MVEIADDNESKEKKNVEDFRPREYQVEILEKAVKQNTIVYMPTGSGKTFIAAMLIKHMSNSVLPKFSEGGKRSFFLVNTVALVTQQASSIRRQLPLEVAEYSGDMGVDYWDGDVWLNELENYQVLVMTAQIFLNMLLHNYIKLARVNLIVLDECHHAVNNHAMRQIMQQFENCPENERPHILGLTATLLNSNCKPEKVENEIHNLEVTMHCKIVTALNEDMVQMYSTNPKEQVIRFRKTTSTFEGQNYIEQCICFLLSAIKRVKLGDLDASPDVRPQGGQLIYDGKKNIKKKLVNILRDIQTVANELGIYAASKAALARIVLIERLKHASLDNYHTKLLGIITTQLHLLRRQLQDVLDPVDVKNQPTYFATPKLNALFGIFTNFNPENLAIVFVEKRITAKVLFYIFQDLQQYNENFSGIRPDFIVGSNSNPFNDTRESVYERKTNIQTLKRFNSKRTNVLFASDVVEEGIDVQLCNYVIKFDEPKTFRSYIQSKGRARHPESKYILIAEESEDKFRSNYDAFKNIEKNIRQKLCAGRADSRSGGTEKEAKDMLYKNEVPPYFVSGPNGPRVTTYSAISLINRYCSMLPQDKFSNLTSYWWLQKLEQPGGKVQYVVTLQLPINSPIKELIKGLPCENPLSAKRAAALKACELLHKAGELDDNLLPRGNLSELLNDKRMYPMWDYDDATTKSKPGSKKCRRIYEKHFPKWICGCRPKSGVDIYLHMIVMSPNYEFPDNNRQQAFYNLLKSKNHFSLITSNKWPQVCQFPMFMNVGEITVDLLVNVKTLRLTDDEISVLFDFHCLLFTDVLPLVKKFVMRDYDNEENAYIIVPTLEDESGNIEIDWDTVQNHTKIQEIKPVSIEERQGMVITEETYNGKIVVPWYRPKGHNMKYIVTRVCHDETSESPFPSDNYQSYAQYFYQRYNQKVVNLNQPLIEVRAISSKINCLLPRGKSRHGSSRKRKDEDDFEETLVPELCCLLEFPAVYMLKVTLLPSVLHRINYLLLAEELRQKIAIGTGLGIVELPADKVWEPLTVDKTALYDQESEGAHSTIQISDMLNENMEAITKEKYPWGNEQEPIDIERNLKVDLMSVIYYQKFVSAPVDRIPHGSHGSPSKHFTKKELTYIPLSMLESSPEDNIGPQQCEILQTLTGITANDVVNYERLETLGDSFLKFAVSLSLFTCYRDKDEGKLTQVKSKIIGNRNLFYCGKHIELGTILKVYDFAPTDWNVPGFTLLRSVQSIMRDVKIPSALLYQISLSKEERDSGKLGDETLETLHDLLINSQESDESTHTSLTIIGQQAISDKTIADAVESIIGLYLKSCGISGAFKIVNWLGILPKHMCDVNRLLYERAPTALLNPSANIDNHLISPDQLEDTLGYKFKDRSYLLQALSHSSYAHNVTDCYQRLEFLGDAILDFLITGHIYDKCGDLSPGELTDLRSSLVNNVTFACLSVRYGFHKHMLARACKLTEIINKFVQHQENRNHAIGAEVLFLLEEKEVQVAESIDVPKVLGDLFESLAAAIYLDSGKCLKTVWTVFYSLMAKEIEEFSKNVPKNHIRLLYEQFPAPAPKFGKAKIVPDDAGVLIPLEVNCNGVQKIFHGIGENKALAKLAAAKLALRYFHTPQLREEKEGKEEEIFEEEKNS